MKMAALLHLSSCSLPLAHNVIPRPFGTAQDKIRRPPYHKICYLDAAVKADAPLTQA